MFKGYLDRSLNEKQCWDVDRMRANGISTNRCQCGHGQCWLKDTFFCTAQFNYYDSYTIAVQQAES